MYLSINKTISTKAKDTVINENEFESFKIFYVRLD